MPNLQSLLPSGLARLLDSRNRLRKLNLPGRYSLSRDYRRALEISRIEILPPTVRGNLKCVVDVGANIGEWSSSIVMLGNAQQVVAFEPAPEVFQTLRSNVQKFPQIKCINSAVGAHKGEVVLNVEENSNSLSSVLTMRDEVRPIFGITGQQPRQVTVPVVTLDEALAEQPEISLLKIDVQGYEPEVLAGAPAVLKRTKVLMIEVVYAPYYQNDVQFETLHQTITSVAPLKLYGISEPGYHPETGQPLWADAIYYNSAL
jgi:FkbM family methyltransferase